MYGELTKGSKIIHEFIVRQLDLNKVKERKKNITLCGFRRIGRDLSYLSFSQFVCVCKKAPLLQEIHTSYLVSFNLHFWSKYQHFIKQQPETCPQ